MKKLIAFVLAVIMTAVLVPGAVADESAAQGIVVDLEMNGSTGYAWMTSIGDDTVAAVEDLGTEIPDTEAVGVPGRKMFRITGLSAGVTVVTFTYSRPWESVQPDVRFTLRVTVDEQGAVHAGEEIVLACDDTSGWSFGMEEGLLEVDDMLYAPEVGQYFGFKPLTPGSETVTFTKSNMEGPLPGVFTFRVDVTDEAADIVSVSYSRTAPEADVPFAPDFLFTTTDREGNTVTEQIFAGHSLTILNFWEPWCGPCVSEMPSLQQLSEEYADRGVQVIGVYASPNMEDDVDTVLDYTQVTYPIIHYVQEFNFLQTGYVPTTVIINGSGTIVHAPFAGAIPYKGWTALIEGLL